MPQTSVPNDALMKTQQAKDSAAKKRTKSKAKPARKTAPKANAAARTGKAKAKSVKAASAPGRDAVKPEPVPSALKSPSGSSEQTRSGWGLGRLFGMFSRTRGEKALEKASDLSLGKGK